MQEESKRALDVEAIKEFVERAGQPENIADLKHGITDLMKTKNDVLKIICRVMGWQDWLAALEAEDDGNLTRSLAHAQFVAQHPEIVVPF